ncbi:DNA-binding CsgD family transcriptional regulator/predicted ATPase [Catenulispora sp. MAP12-49]|uniref:helix-turn-helix transcriptional regulator n=1 Tax=unclassified Catenulispora TaxID=414885 RepID=UPI0035164C1D
MSLTHSNLLTFLQGQLAASGTESGRTIVVSGDPGSGKTTVLRAFVDHAENAGTLTLSSSGTPDEQSLRAGILEQLVSNTMVPEKTRRRITRLVSSIDGDDIHSIHQAGAALLDLCRAQPVVIAVDDVHFADHWSIRLLCHLHRRVRSARLLVVLTRWSRMETGPSPQADLTALACRQVELAPPPPAVVAVADRESPIDALHEALRRWGPPMAEVSRAMAVLGEQADAESIARFVSGPMGVAEEMIGILEQTGLATDGRYRQPPLGGAVLAVLPADELVRLHQQAAAVTYRRGRGARIVAGHLLAAGLAEPGWPVATLRAAAEQAASSDDVGFATRCLELALATVTEARDQIQIRAAVARITWRRAPEIASRNVPPLRDAVRSGLLVDASALVRDALWRGDREPLPDALHRLRSADPQTRAEIRLAGLWHFGPNDLAPAPADPTDSPWLRVTETLADGWLNGADDTAVAGAELVLRNCRLADLSLEALAIALCVLPNGEQAERWCTRLLDEATERGADTWRALLGSVRAWLRLRTGDEAAAAEQAAAALRMIGVEGWGAAVGFPLAVQVLAHTRAGRHDEAAEALRVPVPAAMFGTLNGLRYLHARGHHHLATGRVLAAVGDFQRCRRLAKESGLRQSALVPWRRDLANAMKRLSTQLGDADPSRVNKDPGKDSRTTQTTKSPASRLTLPAAATFDHAASPLTYRVRENTAERLDALAVELSEAERKVAEMAAVGMSNRQISGDLYVTVSTVEQHLTRVYKKLGVTGRRALAARLGVAAG